MSARRILGAAAALALAACTPTADARQPASWTMVVGLDVSGSFRDAHYDDAVDFAAHYIHAHLNGLGGLRVPTALFVGSVGGSRADEPKSFHPINDFAGRSVEEIATDLRTWFPPADGYTDFNVFFERVSGLVKERGLILAPISVVVLSDGVPDVTGGVVGPRDSIYARIDVAPLEFLARSVTVRLLYASPTVGEKWKTAIKRRRVRVWTQDADVMAGWRRQVQPGVPLAEQDALWKWVHDNVDYRVRAVRFM